MIISSHPLRWSNFAATELITRIKAVLRRPGGARGLNLDACNIQFDTIDRTIKIKGKTAWISKPELALLELLMRRKGRVLLIDCIENALDGFDAPPP